MFIDDKRVLIWEVWGVDVFFYTDNIDGLSIKRFWDSVHINDGIYRFPFKCDYFELFPDRYKSFSKLTLRYYPSLVVIRPIDNKKFTIIFDDVFDLALASDDDFGCLVSYGSKMYDVLNNFYSDIMHIIYSYLKGEIHG